MKFFPKLLGLFVACALTLFAACRSSVAPSIDTNRIRADGIQDGRPVADSDLISQSVVTLHFHATGGTEMLCTGIVLSPSVILTAAHCAVDRKAAPGKKVLPPANFTVIEESGNRIGVLSVLVNPLFVDSLGPNTDTPGFQNHDLALLQLKQNLSSGYQPVQLSTDDEALFREEIKIAGFGYTTNQFVAGEETLHEGKIHLNPAETTLPIDVTYTSNTGDSFEQKIKGTPVNSRFSRAVSFYKDATSAGFCHGDSGGPLYFEKQNRVQLLAVNTNYLTLEKDDPLCPRPKNYSQVSMLMASQNLRFVVTSFKTLTGNKIPGISIPEISSDPSDFPSYFVHAGAPEKNTWLDLEKKMAVQMPTVKGSENNIYLINEVPEENPCTTFAHQESLNPELYLTADRPKLPPDGNSASMLSKDILVKNIYVSEDQFESRYKIEGSELTAVVLTPAGFLVRKMKYTKCQ